MQKSSQDVPLPTRLRCAIYTRKSTEEGLEQEFNSLDAQPAKRIKCGRCAPRDFFTVGGEHVRTTRGDRGDDVRICPPVNLCRSSTGERGSGGWFSTPGTSSRSFPFGARLLTEVAAHSGETEKPYPERVMARRCEASQRAILLWRRERFPAAVAIFPSKSNRPVNQKVGENPKSKHICLPGWNSNSQHSG